MCAVFVGKSKRGRFTFGLRGRFPKVLVSLRVLCRISLMAKTVATVVYRIPPEPSDEVMGPF